MKLLVKIKACATVAILVAGCCVSVSAQAGDFHTSGGISVVASTVPANGVNGAAAVITLGGNVGDSVALQAYQGVWYLAVTTATLT